MAAQPIQTSHPVSTRAAKLIATAVVTLVILTPLSAALGRPESVAAYLAFGSVCHQLPERSWWLAGQPLAVCVRCFGFYLGGGGAVWLGLVFDRRTFALCTAALGVTWAFEALGPVAVPPGVRFLAGLLFGVSIASALQLKQSEVSLNEQAANPATTLFP